MKSNIALLSVLTAVILLGLLPGCSKSDDKTPPGIGNDPWAIGSGGFTVNNSHFLLRFFDCEEQSLSARTVDDNRLITVRFNLLSEETMFDYRHAEKPEKYPEQAAKYESLCKRYNDTEYPEEHRLLPYWSGRCYPVDNFVSIGIVSDTDYDAQHPAGSSLADICEILTCSPLDYLESGYTETYDWKKQLEVLTPLFGDEVPGWGPELKPVYKRLDECRAEELVLAGYYPNFFTLRFPQAPATKAERRFTLTLTDESGSVKRVETERVSW